jgi:hypothetical protein
MNLSILALYRGLALFHIRVHIEIPSVLYTFLEICVPTPNFVACRISVYDTLKFATKSFFIIYCRIGPGPSHCRGFTITLRNTTLGRTPLNEWSARRRDLYLTKHNAHKRSTFIPPAEFEPSIPASERPQTARPLGSAEIGSHSKISFRGYPWWLLSECRLSYGIGKYTGERERVVCRTQAKRRGAKLLVRTASATSRSNVCGSMIDACRPHLCVILAVLKE